MKGIRSMNLSLPVISLLLLLTAGSVIAAVYFSLQLPSTVSVLSYEIELWNEGKTALITSFDFGIVQIGESVTSEVGYVKNIGDANIWFAWFVDNLPADFTLTCEYYNPSSSDWVYWPLGSFGTGPNNSGGLAPDAFCEYKMRFVLTNDAAGSGTYSFTIRLDSADTSSG